MKRSILETVAHRPRPLPQRPWVMQQVWSDLLFAHWRAEPSEVAARLPRGLELDTFEGAAWIGIVPFRVSALRARYLPPIPGLSSFPELNLRTYVRRGAMRGVYFFTLEAAHPLAVMAARRTFQLPYHLARMHCARRGDRVDFESERVSRADGRTAFRARYGPEGGPFSSEPGTAEHFLTERYALFTEARDGRLLRTDIHHLPWPLQPASAEIDTNTIAASHRLDLLGRVPLLHYAARQEVAVWAPTAG